MKKKIVFSFSCLFSNETNKIGECVFINVPT